MIIVERIEDFEPFLERFQTEDSFVQTYLADARLHSVVNELSVLWVYLIELGQEFVLVFNHNEGLSLPIECLKRLNTRMKVYTLNKKILNHKIPSIECQDLNFLQYLHTNKGLEEISTICEQRMKNQYFSHLNVNKAIPLMKIVEGFQEQTKVAMEILNTYKSSLTHPSYLFLNNIAVTSLGWVEQNGLAVKPDGFLAHFGTKFKRFVKDGLVYSDYNLFTSTGRCSNRFGGINFAALGKKDATREQFISRFGNDGILVSIDFESYHLRLIADLIGFQLPDEAVHTYLGKQYFKTDNLSSEEYEAGKVRSFQLLYGEDMEIDIPFFVEVQKYIKYLWELINKQGWISSPIYNKKILLEHIEEPSPAKIFNYLVQLTETEYNLTKIQELMPIFDKMESKIILYTYDAILMDMLKTDIKNLRQTIDILEENGKFPVRIYTGKDYQNLTKIQRK